MEYWVIQTLNGVSLAMVLFLLAAGLTLIFGLMQIINMAHGSYYLLAAYVSLTMIRGGRSFLLAAAVGLVLVTLVGVGMQRLCLSRLYKEELPQALLTLGFLFIFADIAFWTWGGNPQLLPTPAALAGSITIRGISYPTYRLFLIAVGAVMALLLWAFLERTKLGAVVRAGMDDEEMVRGIGINMPLVFTGVFALGTALAALSGILGAPLLGVFPGADFEVTLLAFVVVTVGGLGSIRGALVGSLLVGLVDNFGIAVFPQLSLFTIFAPMVIILALRPHGLLGRS